MIIETIDAQDAVRLAQGALGELFATLTAQQMPHTGPAGGIYADEVFTHHCRQATIFLSCADPVRPMGRVSTRLVPAAELAPVRFAGTSGSRINPIATF